MKFTTFSFASSENVQIYSELFIDKYMVGMHTYKQ